VLERYGAGKSPYRALVELDNAYLIDNERYYEKSVFISEHVDPNARFSLVEVIHSRYVFSFSSNFTDTQPGDFTALSAGVSEYTDDLFFRVITVEADALPEGILFFELTFSNRAPMTYRAVRSGDTVTATVPFTDLTASGYELSLIVKLPDGTALRSFSVPLYP